jgi:hypothetical protein
MYVRLQTLLVSHRERSLLSLDGPHFEYRMRKYWFVLSNGIFKYTLYLKCREFGVKTDGTYGKP